MRSSSTRKETLALVDAENSAIERPHAQSHQVSLDDEEVPPSTSCRLS
jgi:hypothetical protein